jgi:hypothetical protein
MVDNSLNGASASIGAIVIGVVLLGGAAYWHNNFFVLFLFALFGLLLLLVGAVSLYDQVVKFIK